jgi:hypothetical protein
MRPMCASGPLVDRAERKAIAARMRRGEPAPTSARARTEMAAMERIVRAWWLPLAWLLVGLTNLVLLLFFGVGPLGLAAACSLITLGLAVWHELHRRAAARLLDANRRRWGNP